MIPYNSRLSAEALSSSTILVVGSWRALALWGAGFGGLALAASVAVLTERPPAAQAVPAAVVLVALPLLVLSYLAAATTAVASPSGVRRSFPWSEEIAWASVVTLRVDRSGDSAFLHASLPDGSKRVVLSIPTGYLEETYLDRAAAVTEAFNQLAMHRKEG